MSSRKSLTLQDYVRFKTGKPMGAEGSLRAMLMRSFGADRFDRFWTHWNPIFSFYLGKFIFAPVYRWFGRTTAFIVTFTVNGLIHDIVTMAVRGAGAFFFTPWFFYMGILVIICRNGNFSLAGASWISRALVNTILISGALLLTTFTSF